MVQMIRKLFPTFTWLWNSDEAGGNFFIIAGFLMLMIFNFSITYIGGIDEEARLNLYHHTTVVWPELKHAK